MQHRVVVLQADPLRREDDAVVGQAEHDRHRDRTDDEEHHTDEPGREEKIGRPLLAPGHSPDHAPAGRAFACCPSGTMPEEGATRQPCQHELPSASRRPTSNEGDDFLAETFPEPANRPPRPGPLPPPLTPTAT